MMPAFADIDQDRAEGIAWLLQQQNGDGSWGEGGARVATTGEALEALRLAGVERGFLYTRGLSWLANVKTDSVDSLARKIIALENAGFDTVAMGMVDDLIARRNTRDAWGSFEGYAVGHPDTGLAIQALASAGVDPGEWSAAVSRLQSAQKPGDFGWSYMSHTLDGGSESLIMPTAHNLIALAHYRQFVGSGAGSQMTRGVKWLLQSKRQLDGSFVDEVTVTTGVVQQTALAWLAIRAANDAGIEPANSAAALVNAQSFLLGQQQVDGSWNGDALHTALALRTFPATNLLDTDDDSVPDAVENLLGTDPTESDVRDLIASNGFDPDGLDASGFSATAIVMEAIQDATFSYTPGVSGGTPGYQWAHDSGVLPTGVTLQSAQTGALAGTPAHIGIFSFSLRVTDTDGREIIVPGSIRVIAAGDQVTDSDGDGLWSSFEIANGSDPMDARSTAPTGLVDSDGDGLPDSWEQANGQDPNNANDAQFDSDGDSWSNITEYQQGTDPLASDVPLLAVDEVVVDEDATIKFNVLKNDSGDLLSGSLSVTNSTSNGTLVDHGSGDFAYTPEANFHGTDGYQYRVCASNDLCATALVSIDVQSVNDLPLVSVGDDKTVGGLSTVTLISNSSDLDGSIQSYNWIQVSGEPVNLDGADSDRATLQVPDLGLRHELIFELQVTDNEGGVGSDQLTIFVEAGLDSDSDGVLDEEDDFPFDPNEWLDTDGDGIGNNADLNDDNDGISDLDELDRGRNPLVDEAVLMVIIKSISN